MNIIYFFLNKPRVFKQLLVLVIDILIIIFSIWISYVIQEREVHTPENSQYFVYLIAIIIAIPIFYFFKLYREVFRYVGTYAFINILKANILFSIIFLCFIFLIKTELNISSSLYGGIPKSVILIQPFLLFALMFFSRFFAKEFIYNSLKSKNINKNIIVYGVNEIAAQIQNSHYFKNNYNILGFIDDKIELKRRKVNSTNIYHSNLIGSLIRQYNISEVIIADSGNSQAEKNKIINELKNHQLKILSVNDKIFEIESQDEIKESIQLNAADLLGRKEFADDKIFLNNIFQDQVILVTGAGGSIGSEICKKIIETKVKKLIILDSNEFALYKIEKKLYSYLKKDKSNIQLISILTDIKNEDSLERVFNRFNIDIIFHAAAYKHVPIVEENVIEGVNNNILGTLKLCEIAFKKNVKNFTLISTDKAVRPTNVMGATKRVAEMIVQAYAEKSTKYKNNKFSIVRFGNVLDSTGSVIPLFREQIESGGPITLTHKDVTRYFMTISEASQLVIESSLISKGGEIFILKMGDPINIIDLARRMIELSGLKEKNISNPNGDIEIETIGLRPGEKIFEELLIDDQSQSTSNNKIFVALEKFLSFDKLNPKLESLFKNINIDQESEIKEKLKNIVQEYSPK